MVVAPVMPLERRCQYKYFAFVYPYASVKNMGSAVAVLFGGGAPVLKLDIRQGSVTSAKTSVPGGEHAVRGKPFPYFLIAIILKIV